MYDLIVIGGGPGGYLAAERAGQAGLSTLLIEKDKLGGVCLNEGCIPSKALLNSAKLFEYANDEASGYGVTGENATIDHKAVIGRKDMVVGALCRGVEMQMKKIGVTVVKAQACIEGRSDELFRVSAGNEVYEAKQLIIASGASAVIPPIDGVEEGLASGFCITSREALSLKESPKELVIIGGGVIGMELASYYNSIGTRVTVVEALAKLSGMDAEIAKQVCRIYEKRGMTFHFNSKVTSVNNGTTTFVKGEDTVAVPYDKVLIAVGRRANTAGLGLENIGVKFTKAGIKTDGGMRTSTAGVYAIGDCTGKTMLAHYAYRGAEVAVNNILGKGDSIDGNTVPSVVYLHPEAAAAGMTEEEATAIGRAYRVLRLPAAYSGRAMAESNDGTGMCKLIVDAETDTLLGAHLLSPYASEIILSCVVFIDEKLPIERIKKFIFPHPTVGELIRETLFM